MTELQELRRYRRDLHRIPELDFDLPQTIAYVEGVLAPLTCEVTHPCPSCVCAFFDSGVGAVHATAIRADMDALPIAEATGAAFASTHPGKMHACGHDGHMAMALAAATFVDRTIREQPGAIKRNVLFVFQPAEEKDPGGASLVLAEKPFEGYDVAAVIGEHVDADLEVGEIGFCPGKFMASADELHFKVKGVGGHAAMRERIKDSVVAAADLILRLNRLNSDVCVVSIGHVAADGATNVIPEQTVCDGTMRTFDENLRARVKQMIAHIAEEIEYKYDVEIENDLRNGYPCVENDRRLTYEAMMLADSKGFVVKDLDMRTTAEDFGFYTHVYPSLFYRLGVGRASGRSHTATFLPDERALAVGEEFMYELALNILNK